MAKWTTWVGTSTTPPSNAKTTEVDDAPERRPVTYASYEDVPAAFKENLRIAHESGLSVENLHHLFELPIEWIERAVEPHH